MQHVRTLIIGAGQAGLALSWHLTAIDHEHVVVDRGVVAQRWRHERWDSLRTITPNWMSRLPGRAYDGPEPDGYMAATEVAHHLASYAADFALPVSERTAVESVTTTGDGFSISTDRGVFRADHVVVATGWCERTRVPDAAAALPDHVVQIASSDYRRATQLPDGPVLVVGASASGVQIAEELQRAGRDVILAVGRHTRVPRSYRGVDIHSWLEQLGDLDRARDAGDDRRVEPSLQLIGRPADQPLDLGTLQSLGVQLTGRVASVTSDRVAFSDDLDANIAAADARLQRLLHRIDAHFDAHVDRTERPRNGTSALERHLRDIPTPVVVPRSLRSVPLGGAGIRGVVWATGFARAYPWLRLPVFDHRGEIAHHRGVTAVPGCFTIGMQFQTRRRSTFIDGVRFDAAEIAARLDCPGPALTRAREYAGLAS